MSGISGLPPHLQPSPPSTPAPAAPPAAAHPAHPPVAAAPHPPHGHEHATETHAANLAHAAHAAGPLHPAHTDASSSVEPSHPIQSRLTPAHGSHAVAAHGHGAPHLPELPPEPHPPRATAAVTPPAPGLEGHAFHVNPALGGLVDTHGAHASQPKALHGTHAPAVSAAGRDAHAFHVNPALGGLVDAHASHPRPALHGMQAPVSRPAHHTEHPKPAHHAEPIKSAHHAQPVHHAQPAHHTEQAKPAPASQAKPSRPPAALESHSFHVNPAVGGLVDAHGTAGKAAHHAALSSSETERLKQSIALHRLEESLHEGHVETALHASTQHAHAPGPAQSSVRQKLSELSARATALRQASSAGGGVSMTGFAPNAGAIASLDVASGSGGSGTVSLRKTAAPSGSGAVAFAAAADLPEGPERAQAAAQEQVEVSDAGVREQQARIRAETE